MNNISVHNNFETGSSKKELIARGKIEQYHKTLQKGLIYILQQLYDIAYNYMDSYAY